MEREVVSQEAIVDLLRSQMSLLPACSACTCVGVQWRAPDAVGGSNWVVSGIEGEGCVDCLRGLTALPGSPRKAFELAVPEASLRIERRRPARVVVAVVPRTVVDCTALRVDDLIRASSEAVKASRLVLGACGRSRRATNSLCRESATAIASSRRLLGDPVTAGRAAGERHSTRSTR